MEKNNAPKKARIVRNPAAATNVPPQEEGEDISTTTIQAYLEQDTLECPICLCPFEAAIFQASIRCRPLENAIAAMSVPCAFARNGCTQRLKLAAKGAHEALYCRHAPCTCPFKGCAYAGLELHDHILNASAAAAGTRDPFSFVSSVWQVALHRRTPFRALLHPVEARVFLLLNGGDVPGGRSLSVVCLGPRPAGNQALEYKMEVNAGGATAAPSMSGTGPVPCTRRWAGHYPTGGFLFVPDEYWNSSGSVSVTVEVRKATVDKGKATVDKV